MRKALSILLTAGMIVSLAGCGSGASQTEESTAPQTTVETTAETTVETMAETTVAETETSAEAALSTGVTINLGGLKGPTSIGMVKLLEDADAGTTANTYNFTIAGSADELTPKLLKGELDILAVPVNLGSVLYNNSDGATQMIAINTLGVLYMCEKGGSDIKTIEDLKGQTIYATGKGTTPEYALTYLLAQHGMDINSDVTMEWMSEPTETVAAMAAEEHAVAMLPQPYVTVAQTQIEDLQIVLDLTKEWDALDNGSKLITAGLIVRKQFAEEHPEAIAAFLEEYKASTDWVNANVDDAAQLVEKYDIVKAPIAKKAIPYCNITCITGEDMVTSTKGYLQILLDQNPKSVGGQLPGDDFYYVGQ